MCDMTSTPSEMMTTEQVAVRLHISPAAVRQRAKRGTGPPSVKVGRRRLYRRTDVAEWLERSMLAELHKLAAGGVR